MAEKCLSPPLSPYLSKVKEGDSGWGPTGAVVSDSYISHWLEALDCAFPCDYQIITAWVASSADMLALAASAGQV